SSAFDSRERAREESRRLAVATAQANARRNLAALVVCAVFLVFMAYFAYRADQEARKADQEARKATEAAEVLANTRARTLASRGREYLDRSSDAGRALLIGLAGLQGVNSVKYVPEAEALVYDALQSLRESRVFRIEDVTQISSVSYSRKDGT